MLFDKEESQSFLRAEPEPGAQPKRYSQLIGRAQPPPHIRRHSRSEANWTMTQGWIEVFVNLTPALRNIHGLRQTAQSQHSYYAQQRSRGQNYKRITPVDEVDHAWNKLD